MPSLHNPSLGLRRVGRVMADIDEDVFNYFFNAEGPSVFTKTRGARQALVAQFFKKLHEQCLAEGVPPRWEPDNESRVQAMMDRMSLAKPKVTKPRTKKVK